MEDIQAPVCSHDNARMTKVWADAHGNAVYQCPVCGRKSEIRENGSRR